MTKKERQRRAKLRRQARARRARKLFREFVANKKREWDAMVDAANRDRDYAYAERNRVKAMFNTLVEQIIAINPEFPYPGREYHDAPAYISASGLEMVVPTHKWPALRAGTNHDWSSMTARAIENWYTFIRFDLDNDRMRCSRAFTITTTNMRSRQQAAIQMAVSEIALSSEATMELMMTDIFRQAYRGIVEHMRKDA